MLEVLLLLLFAGAAWCDYSQHRIPDIITATGWFLICLNLFFGGISAVGIVAIAAAAFGTLYFFNTVIYVSGYSPPVFGWGDILLFPLYVAYSFLYPGLLLLAALPFMLLGCYVFFEIGRGNREIKKQNIPLAPFILLSALTVFVVQTAL